jgi:hypothetical protein
VASPQPAWAPKTRIEGNVFYFVRKSSWSTSEAARAFGIEQAQKIIGESKLAPLRGGLRPVWSDRPNPAITRMGSAVYLLHLHSKIFILINYCTSETSGSQIPGGFFQTTSGSRWPFHFRNRRTAVLESKRPLRAGRRSRGCERENGGVWWAIMGQCFRFSSK